MFHLRYGLPSIRDCIFTIFLLFALFLLGIASFLLEYYFYGTLFILVTALSLMYVLLPFLEFFCIDDHIITTRKYGRVSKKAIPQIPVIIISEADVHEKFGHQSFKLRAKYAVTILDEAPLDTILDQLFREYSPQFKYTNSTIEHSFQTEFIYSFAFNREALEHVLNSSHCLVIIPESLVQLNHLKNLPSNIYIDNRC